jgi:hypothetical protein
LKLETGTVRVVGIGRLDTLFGLGLIAIDFSLDDTAFLEFVTVGN